jgi:hypothetical protein
VDAIKIVNEDGVAAIGVTHDVLTQTALYVFALAELIRSAVQRRWGYRRRDGRRILARGEGGDTETPGPSRAYKGQGDVKKKVSNTPIFACGVARCCL